MNYKHHYDKLMIRAKKRNLNTYCERHHIIPRCIGGDDTVTNIVKLTPEEHYIAHQLLCKIYPNHIGLLWSVIRMTGHKNKQRSNNKVYGWIRRRFSEMMKQKNW